MGSSRSYEERYTRPELRRRIKERLRESDEGGPAGTWSARKSQLLVKEYERGGGGYRGRANVEEARSLHEWTEQRWQTRDGSTSARDDDRMHRYLPEEAWERLSPEERRRAERTKARGSRRGERRVAWTPAVARVMREIEEEPGAEERGTRLYVRAKERGVRGRSKMSEAELREAVERGERRRTRAELYERAKELDVRGRSKMNKAELARAVRRRERS